MAVHRIDRIEARRIAIRAQLLHADRPTDLLKVVQHLTFLQLDPTAAIAPSADLVAWTRLGDGYRPADLTAALERDRTLYEVRAIIRPTVDLALHLAQMAAWPFADEGKGQVAVPGPGAARWLDANDAFARTSLRSCGRPGPCCHATYRTPASCRGSRRAGRATATSPRCWSSCRPAARSPPRDAADGSVCGTSPSVSTRRSTRSSRWPRRAGSWQHEDCAHSALPGPRWSASQGSGSSSRSRESPPRSKGRLARGLSMRRRSANRSRVGRPCCRRSTA